VIYQPKSDGEDKISLKLYKIKENKELKNGIKLRFNKLIQLEKP
jgi:hypothetical protein